MHLRRISAWVVATTLALGLPVLSVATSTPAVAVDNGLALTPPMGWNDWNSFGCNINEQDVKDTIDLFVSKGLRDAGYQYINIDDCWAEATRDADGNLQASATDFPHGIAYLADYAHDRGLKLGIYSSAGDQTCQRVQPGSLGHELADARTFVSWGVDYLKYDNCGAQAGFEDTKESYIARYKQMADAIAQVKQETGKTLLYSICEWGNHEPWTWAGEQGNLWRTTFDISDNYASMLNIFKQNVGLGQYAKPGAWNDPDMLQVGNGGMSNTEYRTHFGLWAMMAAPLLIGTDLRKSDAATMDIFLNKDVIGIDQDTLGKQASIISEKNGLYVLAKPLANGDVAVALFNSGSKSATISTTAGSVGAASSKNYKLTDLWSKEATATTKTISAYVGPHATKIVRVSTTSEVRPATTLSMKVSDDTVKGRGKTWISATLRNNSSTKISKVRTSLTKPTGWRVLKKKSGSTVVSGKGHSTTTRWLVKAPKSTVPVGTAEFTAKATFRAHGITYSDSSTLSLSTYDPISSKLKVANTTDSDVVAGQIGNTIQIEAAGAGVGPAERGFGGSTPAVDEYGSVYAKKSVATNGSVVAKVATVGGTTSGDRTGVIIRNDMDGKGTPVGVALYVNGQKSVSMVYSDAGGKEYTKSNPVVVLGPPGTGGGGITTTLPVVLKLERAGSTFTGYYSTDGGSTFTRVGGSGSSVTIANTAVATRMDAGVFHTSGATTSATKAEVRGLKVS